VRVRITTGAAGRLLIVGAILALTAGLTAPAMATTRIAASARLQLSRTSPHIGRHHNVVIGYTVANIGHVPLQVTGFFTSLIRTNRGCIAASSPVTGWANMTSRNRLFRLRPGHRRSVVVTVDVPRDAKPNVYDLTTEFRGIPVGISGRGITISQTVGSQLDVAVPGHIAKGTAKPCLTAVIAKPPPAAAAFPVLDVGALAFGIVAVMVVAFITVIRKRRPRHAH
jgi:hypothetical protein